jgi:predicted hotdog family 3-hydroxylacyl-ACP dehydratase
MNEFNFTGPVTQLLPHRRSMLLVDRLLEATDEMVRVEAVVKRGSCFVTEEGLPGWVGAELMAQAMACWSGWQQLRLGNPARLGFLVSLRRYECSLPFFPIGSHLVIEARPEFVADNGLAAFFCTIFLEDREVARSQVNSFQPADLASYLQGAQHD